LRRAEGGANIFGVFCVNILGGGAPGARAPPPGSAPVLSYKTNCCFDRFSCVSLLPSSHHEMHKRRYWGSYQNNEMKSQRISYFPPVHEYWYQFCILYPMKFCQLRHTSLIGVIKHNVSISQLSIQSSTKVFTRHMLFTYFILSKIA
jgi:hypothetical protein